MRSFFIKGTKTMRKAFFLIITVMIIAILPAGVSVSEETGCYRYIKNFVIRDDTTQAILSSSQRNNISSSILLAYLLTENSSFENLPQNSSGDVGLFQININYHPYSLDVLRDIFKNAYIAGTIIRKVVMDDPSLRGLARYHSSIEKFNRRYRRKLVKNLAITLREQESYPLCE